MTDIATFEPRHQPAGPARREPVALVDLLDRLLGSGVVLSGDITVSIAGVDLVEIRLHALLTSVRAEMRSSSTAEREQDDV
ncbi:gas vesicle protein [Microlunatus soli]|uniref:Gas vesicle protein n=1 Tax=Microlunatus soli TaxID=630515 RepID=A0A1H1NCZ1_9ACTN|nr:gas vesicle protein [Microlunatus soli]SDR96824.1 Gas vesicle protein [Microlunatus soli]